MSSNGKRQLRVLLVDDHDLFRTGLCALLEEEGFEVASSPTAESALRRLSDFRAGARSRPTFRGGPPVPSIRSLSGPEACWEGVVDVAPMKTDDAPEAPPVAEPVDIRRIDLGGGMSVWVPVHPPVATQPACSEQPT
jgi:CheY-like chemotaxis protein